MPERGFRSYIAFPKSERINFFPQSWEIPIPAVETGQGDVFIKTLKQLYARGKLRSNPPLRRYGLGLVA